MNVNALLVILVSQGLGRQLKSIQIFWLQLMKAKFISEFIFIRNFIHIDIVMHYNLIVYQWKDIHQSSSKLN